MSAPFVAAVTPAEGLIVGGQAITITGTGFVATPTVTIGGVAATSVVFVDANTLTVVTPVGVLGPADVIVTNPDAVAFTLVNGYLYVMALPVTDLDQLSEIQLRVLEPDDSGATWPSNLWTRTEVLDYYNQRINRFNRDTRMLLAFASVPTVANQVRYTDGLPQDWIVTQRARYMSATGVRTPLHKADGFSIDHAPSGRTPSLPLIFDEATPPLLAFDLYPAAPDSLGYVELLYASLCETLDGTGMTIDIPNDFVPYCTYGVLADMFSKDGPARNLAMAQYFEGRFAEGMALAEILLEGRY